MIWRLRHGALSLVLALGLMVVAAPLLGQRSEQHRLSGSEVAVYNLAGEVEIVAGSGSEVLVEVMRGGSDASQLEIAVDEIDGRQTLRVIYPDDRIIYGEMGRRSRTQLYVRSDGTWGGEGRRGDEVEIRGSGSGLEAHADLRISVPAGRSLRVFQAVGEVGATGVQGDLLIDTGSGEVTAEGIGGDLNIDTGSGSVQVAEIQGELLVDTGSGSVELTGVFGESILVDTGSGRVEGDDLEADRIVVDTGSGEIVLRRVSSPDLYLDTGSGGVELELLTDVEDLEIDTGSGSVVVYVPDDLGGDLEVDTGSGGIDLDFPIEVSRTRRTYLRGVIGDGRGSIRIDTGSGGVTISRR